MSDGPAVLVVDDEPAIVRALSAALQARGYRPITASTGAEAINLAATHNLAVIILDLNLPDFDGVEVCRRFASGRARRSSS